MLKRFSWFLGLQAVVGLALVSPFANAQDSGVGKPKADYHVLIIGDSITLHPPKESIQWSNHHGMAASAPEKDYVHLVLSGLRKKMPGTEVKELVPDKAGWVRGALSQMKAFEAFQPNLVVVQLGEHEFGSGRLPRLKEDYHSLLQGFLSLKSKPIVVCTGIWNPDMKANAPYQGDTEQIERTMAEEAASAGVSFVSVEDLARDPSCYGFGEVRGVQWHPNDKGMEGYANRILAAWEKASASAAGK